MKSKILIPIFVLFFLATAVNAFVISGQVTDTNAIPINNSHIEVFNTTGTLVNETYTNETGDYSLEVGNLLRIVNASAASYDTQSTPIFVNDNKTVNFVLGPIDAVYLSGFVTNITDDPLNSVDIKVKQGVAIFTETNTDPSGFYNVSVLDGQNYDVTASLVGYDSITKPGNITGNTELNFTLQKTPPACVEDWSCDAWSICSGSTQTRTCIDLNNCGTEYNKPAESQSCTTYNGDSGGRSSDRTTYRISLITSGTTQRVRERDIVKFDFKSERHTVKITDIGKSSVSLLVESDPISATLEMNQTGKYDLDNDEIYDLQIDINDILSSYKATLAFFLISEPINPPDPDSPPPVQTYTPPPPPPPKKEIMIEDVVPDQEDNETATPSMFASAVGFVKNVSSAGINFVKKIPYVGYASAGIIILLIIIVAIKLFKAEEVADLSKYDKDQLRKRIGRLEKQITRLKKTF